MAPSRRDGSRSAVRPSSGAFDVSTIPTRFPATAVVDPALRWDGADRLDRQRRCCPHRRSAVSILREGAGNVFRSSTSTKPSTSEVVPSGFYLMAETATP